MAIKKKKGTAVKKVKKAISKNKVSAKKAAPKKKVVAKKAAPKKKVVAKKKAAPKKKVIAKKKAVTAPKKKVAAKKRVTAPKNQPVATKKIKNLVSKTLNPQITPPGENMHFIPEHAENGETTPLTQVQAHQVENNLHNKEEVALHQENKKIKDAFAIRKNPKNIYRRGRRS
jgi:hypothetical protein